MFFTTAGLLAGPVLGLLDLHIERRAGQAAGRDHADARAVRGRLADLAARAAPRVRGAAAAAGHRPAADDRRRRAGRRARDAGQSASPRRWCWRSCSPAPTPRSDRPSSPTSAFRRGSARAERRERAQRRALRAAVLHRDRRRRGRRRHDVRRTPPRRSCSSRSATGSSAASSPASLGGARAARRRAPRADRAALAADPRRRLRRCSRPASRARSAAASSSPRSSAASCSARCARDTGGEVSLPRRRGRRAASTP